MNQKVRSSIDAVSAKAALTTGTTMHYVVAGSGTPVVLLHGFPQTSTCWNPVIPHLANHYTVVAPDLRGLGSTTLPDEATFEKRTLAAEVVDLVINHLGFEEFHVVGHDWGGVVAFSIAAHYRANSLSLSVIDVSVPSSLLPDMAQGGRRWHHGFHKTPGLPEALVLGREADYVTWFYDNYGLTPAAISAEQRAEYIRAYSQPHALPTAFEYYRAAEQDSLDITAAVGSAPLEMPVLAVGGSGEWGRGSEVRESLLPLVKVPVHEKIVSGAGHWVPEEQPLELAEALLEHFDRVHADREVLSR